MSQTRVKELRHQLNSYHRIKVSDTSTDDLKTQLQFLGEIRRILGHLFGFERQRKASIERELKKREAEAIIADAADDDLLIDDTPIP